MGKRFWSYIGVSISNLPDGFISESKTLTKEQIKFVLSDCPIEYGMAQALNEESLVRTLLSGGVYPIKIKPASIKDIKMHKLHMIKSSVNKPKKKPYETLTYLDHRAKENKMPKTLLFVSIPIMIILFYYIVKNIS